VELQLLTGPAHPQVIDTRVRMEQQWNDTDKEQARTQRKTCPSAILYIANPTWTTWVSMVRSW
jgi:hypothetical protein